MALHQTGNKSYSEFVMNHILHALINKAIPMPPYNPWMSRRKYYSFNVTEHPEGRQSDHFLSRVKALSEIV